MLAGQEAMLVLLHLFKLPAAQCCLKQQCRATSLHAGMKLRAMLCREHRSEF